VRSIIGPSDRGSSCFAIFAPSSIVSTTAAFPRVTWAALLEGVDSGRRSLGLLFRSPSAGDDEKDQQDNASQSGDEHHREEEPDHNAERDQDESGDDHAEGMPARLSLKHRSAR
jgi:hypothetical protein